MFDSRKQPHEISFVEDTSEVQGFPIAMAAIKERVLKFTVMQYRTPKISEEEFHSYWTNKHAVLASTWLQWNGILGYTQVTYLGETSRKRSRC